MGSGRYECGDKYGYMDTIGVGGMAQLFKWGKVDVKWRVGLEKTSAIPFANYDYYYHSCLCEYY